MASDTATTSLALLLMGTGNDDNTWGDLLNAQVIQYVEDALIGRTAVVTTGGATTLTQAQTRPRRLDFSGTLTSDATITVPNVGNGWIVNNATAGAFSLLIKTASGVATEIPQGTSKDVFSDGFGSVYRVDRENIGEYFYHAGTAAPSGAYECNGASLLRASHPDLFTALGTTHGAADGTHFSLPDAYTAGKFLRSRTASVAAGTAQTGAIESHGHAGSSATATTTLSGSVDAAGGHTPTMSSSGLTTTLSGSVAAGGGHTPTVLSATWTTTLSGSVTSDGAHTHSITDPTHVHAGGDLFDAETSISTRGTDVVGTAVTAVNSSGAGNTAAASTGITGANSGGAHQHSISGVTADTQLATFTMNAVAAHQHSITGVTGSTTLDTLTMNAVANHQHGVTGVSATTTVTSVTIAANGGSETRPTNLSGILCVRY